jgi:hypothetical protein
MNLTVKLTPAQLTELKEDIARECRFDLNISAQDDIEIHDDSNNRGRCTLLIPIRGGIGLEGLSKLAETYDPAISPMVDTQDGRTYVRLYSIPQSNLPITLSVI